MSTILVLTDFTIKDNHAAYYALNLASIAKANILLCNVYPQNQSRVHQSEFVDQIYDSLEKQSKSDLSELAGRLQQSLYTVNDGSFKPTIQQCSIGGNLMVAVNELIAEQGILMAVIAAHSKDDFFAWVNTDHASQIIDSINCPVLVLPYQAPFGGFRKIVFASDLERYNPEIFDRLFNIGNLFDSEITITHIGEAVLGEPTEKYILKRHVEGGSAQIKSVKVRYLGIQNKSVTAGLEWLVEQANIDLMVLIHRKRNVFQKLFQKSVTKRLAEQLKTPMLVFPANLKGTTVKVA
ncbi:universal stress protein [Mucilaginibacter boryungensis]|uniref:Universal stress protein n=1 Tax=Mucilaginibacter boryungensis TaxID=768480 RepID=A0ABR9XML1_9SPHI|nr:universal stress protein [Mucilaginibacter boryungensis]MBE9668521.1 universal stress protein [Mucilaginibacter boryungensis]